MPFDSSNKWKSGQIRKKFLNKQTHSGYVRRRGRKNRKGNSASTAWFSRRNLRQRNTIYFNQQCRTYTNLNCGYYQNTFDDFFDSSNDPFESNDDEYSTYYNDDNYLHYDEWKATNKPKIDITQHTETDTFGCEDLDYMIEHTKYVNSINIDNMISRKMARKAAQKK
eukprot:508416_1